MTSDEFRMKAGTKRTRFFCAAAMFLAAGGAWAAARPLNEARSWALYYGPPASTLVERISGYDLVVIDPAALGAEASATVDALRQGGATVLGYLSAFEVATWHEWRDCVPDSWLVRVDGKPWRPWGGTDVGWSANFAASLAEEGWRALLAEIVDSRIIGVGCDGVFLDTLEDLDREELPEAERARQLRGLRRLLSELRCEHPGAPIVCNRTLGATLAAVAEDADGICWEDFAPAHFDDAETRSWMEGVASRLRAVSRRRPADRPFRVLALWNVDDASAVPDIAAAQAAMREKAASFGFLPFCTVGGYQALPPPPVRAESETAAPVCHATVSAAADHAGRCWWAEVKDAPADALRFVWRHPGPEGKPAKTVTEAPRLRRRLPEGARRPFPVSLEIERRAGPAWRTNILVAPPARPLSPPFPENDVAVGICGYDDADRLLSEIVTNEICNLYVHWVDPERCSLTGRLDGAAAAKGRADGLRTMTIYGHYGRAESDALRGEFGNRYLGNNVGEHAGYLYQGPESAKAANVPQDLDVITAKEDFAGRFVRRGPGRDGQPVPFTFSTSGSPLATYELMGGIDFICNELYAVGSANLAYATSEERGEARRWGPPFWCSWLAEEWQTFPIPYGSERKYDLLKAGMLQQWLMGTSLMVLESGAQHSQAHVYTALDPVLDPDGKPRGKRDGYRYDDLPPRRYRETVKEVHDFVRSHPRDPGGPDVRIAFALGNGDSFVGMTTDWFAAWGQHEQAETNSNWRCGEPEETWLRVQDTFFPRPRGALAPFPNHWLAGSPFGQIDVVSVDDESRLSDLSRYSLLAFAGWNTMTPEATAALERYAEEGGTLVLCVPHLSTRRDRDWRNFGVVDLLPAPGGARVVGDPVALPSGIRAAPLDLPWGTVVVREESGVPLVVKTPVGEGCVYLVAAWDYPGNSGKLSDIYDSLLRELAADVPQRVAVSAVAGEELDGTRAVCHAVYAHHAYFLNLDCAHSRSVDVRIDGGRPRRLDLEPLSVATLVLP